MSHNMQQYVASECTKRLITAYIMKDCGIPIFSLVKTMINAYKIVRIGKPVLWTTYYGAGEKCWVTPDH